MRVYTSLGICLLYQIGIKSIKNSSLLMAFKMELHYLRLLLHYMNPTSYDIHMLIIATYVQLYVIENISLEKFLNVCMFIK